MQKRDGFPKVEQLPTFECGCEVPCFVDVSELLLLSEYEEFSKLSRELKPRHKENQYLLNRMYIPLSNSTTHVCNRALANLYTVSETFIADVRGVLNQICEDPSIEKRALLNDSSLRYKYSETHPLRKFSSRERQKIEDSLNLVLRADPAGGVNGTVCRVYSPEVNTQEKLKAVLLQELQLDSECKWDMSSSTLRRMIQDYLKRRNIKSISFTQSDHNACPTCKTMHYAVLQYHHEAKILYQELLELDKNGKKNTPAFHRKREELIKQVRDKDFQEEECLREMQVHTSRDKRIRQKIKELVDYFRRVENDSRAKLAELTKEQLIALQNIKAEWNSLPGRACMTHQDDMTKVDLPHFFLSASSDITRWRFDVNAHVNAVTQDAIVFSHEQGTGPKNASAIIEEILLEHLLSCRGESIKIVVSDNASVGKNWLTTIAFPQCIVDQELAGVALIVFLENNHGKWLADMLFGQFQSKKKRSVILGIDDMLSQFELIKKREGKVRSFALNPLSSIDIFQVFKSLGYETKPSPEFGFVKGNIHFAYACSPEAKEALPSELRTLLDPILPDEPGMVRISTEPPGLRPQSKMDYEDRCFDVPAVKLSLADAVYSRKQKSSRPKSAKVHVSSVPDAVADLAPLVVALDQRFALSGSGVVPSRTADKVGYNGLVFRGTNACPELKDTSKALIRRAWPKGLLIKAERGEGDEPVKASENVKCAPVNWVMRRPVSHFCTSEDDWKARYPPRNLLNARFLKGPRVTEPWIPTNTYSEPPFPIIDGTAAAEAMRTIAEEHKGLGTTLHVLDLLRAVFKKMSRDSVEDPWLQRRATIPGCEAITLYREDLQLLIERNEGHPSPALTAKQLFKKDEAVEGQLNDMVCERGLTGAAEKRFRLQMSTKLFQEAERTPGMLDRFDILAEKELRRYALELKAFKEKQRAFDKERDLIPLE